MKRTLSEIPFSFRYFRPPQMLCFKGFLPGRDLISALVNILFHVTSSTTFPVYSHI